MRNSNPLLSVDSYKLSHPEQYPSMTEFIYAHGLPRKGPSEIPILGLRLSAELLNRGLTKDNVDELRELAALHGVPFFEAGWKKLLKDFGSQGQFPLVLRGVPEGLPINPGTPAFSVVNTNREYFWLVSFFETLILRAVWYPSTVAAVSRECKKEIKKGMEETSDTLDGLDEAIQFKLHDFGARGVSSGESAAIGGMGHLLNFKGTDTIESLKLVKDLYGEPMAGFSIPATEHSTVTSWGRLGEEAMYENFLRTFAGEGKIFACVSDSYNIWEALRKWKKLEPVLLEKGGTLVVRPDSGDPVQTPVAVCHELCKLFGSRVNTKGYRVLPDHIRVIQGDGITKDSLASIVFHMQQMQLSMDNIAFGMGGGLLQQVNRDTYGWAMKTSAAQVDGEWREVYKDPIGGGKTSLKGIVTARGRLPDSLVSAVTPDISRTGFVVYYDNGPVEFTDSWADIRERAEV